MSQNDNERIENPSNASLTVVCTVLATLVRGAAHLAHHVLVLLQRLAEVERAQVVFPQVEVDTAQIVVVHHRQALTW